MLDDDFDLCAVCGRIEAHHPNPLCFVFVPAEPYTVPMLPNLDDAFSLIDADDLNDNLGFDDEDELDDLNDDDDEE